MTTYEYLSGLLGVHNILREDETLTKLVAASSECFDLGDTAVESFFSTPSHVVASNTTLKLKNLITAIRQFQLTETILRLNDLQMRLDAYIDTLEEPTTGSVAYLSPLLRDVRTTYESFIMNSTDRTAYECMKALRGTSTSAP